MERIGTIIRSHRLNKNMTQEELGNKVFVSKQAVSKWETVRTVPDIEMIRKLCEILEINSDKIMGVTVEEVKKSRKLVKLCATLVIISMFAALFFGLDGLGYIDRHTQSGVAYLTVYSNGKLLHTDEYAITNTGASEIEDLKNGYKFNAPYGELRGVVELPSHHSVEYGFVNTNNWHNIQIRLDIEEEEKSFSAKQTVSYETDNKTYIVDINKNEVTIGSNLSVFRGGV